MTREEIISGLEFTVDMFLFDTDTGETYDEPRNDLDKTTIDACNGAIEFLKKEPRWIPVTEDVPPIGTVCLWCNKQGNIFVSEITVCSERTSYVGKHGYFSNGLENHGNIVAWMPLPKAYKGEGEEE